VRRCRSSRWTARRTSERAGSNAVEVPHLSTLLCSRISRQTDRLGREPFCKHGISYELCKQSKSDLYRDLLPRLNSGQVVLPRHDRLVAQICGLERRTGRSGKDSIGHAPNGHDDLANAVAGAAATSRSKYRYDSSLDWVAGPDYGKSDADAA
jgi:hypothetical protein